MEERGVGHWYHPDSDTDWQIVGWGSPENQRELGENRLTRSGIAGSELTTFRITYSNGEERYLTFSGYLPEDLDDVAEYWADHESL